MWTHAHEAALARALGKPAPEPPPPPPKRPRGRPRKTEGGAHYRPSVAAKPPSVAKATPQGPVAALVYEVREAFREAMAPTPVHPLDEEERRCPQCLKWRPWPSQFMGVRGKPGQWCVPCKKHYKGWGTKTPEEKIAARNARSKVFASAGAYRVRWIARSTNAKLGSLPVTMTERGSCPDACAFKNAGCYAEEHNFMRLHWEETSNVGLWWDEFLERVEALPAGAMWRHNEAGDLPGVNNVIDVGALLSLAEANRGRHGFTFTAKPLTPPNARAIRRAGELGFVINLSAHSVEHADELKAAGVAPVSMVLPEGWGDRAQRTPAGHQIVVCPAQTTKGVTCASCGMCAHPGRKAIIGFRAHGNRAGLVSEIVRPKRATG